LANKNYEQDSQILHRLFDIIAESIEMVAQDDTNDHGEIRSMILLAWVKHELLRIGSQNDDEDEVKNVLDNKFARGVMEEFQDGEPTISQAREFVNISTAFLQAGKLKESAEVAKLAPVEAEKLLDRSEMISILIDLLPIYQSLKDTTSFAKTKDRATELAISFIPAGIDLRQVNIAWRTRDIELDRIARKLIELDLPDEAMTTIENVHEPIIFDRVVRTIIYIHLAQNNFPAAESAAKKLRIPEYRFAAKRDTNLMKYLTQQK
jgi:hypothetical protein